MLPTVVVTPRGQDRIQHGHPWVYKSDIADVNAAPGDVVSVVGRPHHRMLGQALFSDQSQIVLRMLTRDDEEVDAAFWHARLSAAIGYRAQLDPSATVCRLVHGEADLLPSLIVDRYGDVLVVQALSQGMDRLLPQLVPVLMELTGATGVLARNDPRVRLLEGLERRVDSLAGEVPASLDVQDGPVHYDVDVWKGQKTGLFLDQRENHAAVAGYARGRGLDCFTYHGGFALRLATACEHVTAIDSSADAVARTKANAERNGLGNLEAREGNVFDELRALDEAGERFDTIVLDPPAFAKNKAALGKALTGYKEINLRALRLLNIGGVLATCTCSYHVDEAMFVSVLEDAARDSGVSVTVAEKRMQSRDHPVLLGVPETHYLKCLILRRLL